LDNQSGFPTISFNIAITMANKVETDDDVSDGWRNERRSSQKGTTNENFMGILIDPEEMITKYEAGVP